MNDDESYGSPAQPQPRPHDDDKPELDGRRAKRAKLSLSCSSCKSRKIKCDRGHPCGNCVKKGLSADQCHVDSLLPDFIARTVDLTTAVARIAAIEQYLSLLPSTLPPFVVVALPAGLIPRAGPVEATAVRMTPSTSFANEEETFSDTEVAAIQLEAFVKGPPQQAEGLSNSQSAGGSSIMAVERPVLVSTSRVHLNVEWDATSTQVKDAQRRAIRKVYRTLPTTPEISYLVDLFFSRVSLFHSIHEPTFRSELEIFSAMGPGRELEVDPLFFALLSMILCVSLDRTHSSTSSAPSPVDGLHKDKSEHLFQSAQLALAVGEWDVYPSIRSVQTIILFTQYLQLSRLVMAYFQRDVWLSGAIRGAQALKLQSLGSNPGTHLLQREVGKRVWAALVYIDYMRETSTHQISPGDFDTPPPSNLNDAQLSLNIDVEPAPRSVLTDASSAIIKLEIATQVRRAFDESRKKDFNYDAVLRLDAGYRAILETLPQRWNVSTEEDPAVCYQRHFILEGLNNRIFRLHRPWSTRGYHQPKYSYSTEACIKAASSVILSTAQIHEQVVGIYYVYSHVFGASLVLFNDLFQAIDGDRPSLEIYALEDALRLAKTIFSRSSEISSASLAAVVEQGSKILSGLFVAEEKRKSNKTAELLRLLSGALIEPNQAELESFANVLTRVGRSLTSQERHQGTPPPSRQFDIAVPATTTLWGDTDDLYRFLDLDMLEPGGFDSSEFEKFSIPVENEEWGEFK